MSGHSRWSQIKHKKAIADAKKGKIFGKLARAISVAARGNPDASTNLRLKAEIERARAVNMPGENIERAVARMTGKDANTLAEIQLELVGPGNSAIIVQAITDNSNRTISELKQLAGTMGAHPAGQGSLLWMFKKSGAVRLPPETPESIQLAAIDAGADDVQEHDDGFTVFCAPERLDAVRTALGTSALSWDVEYVPTTTVPIDDEVTRNRLSGLLDALDEHDDVQEVFTNAHF